MTVAAGTAALLAGLAALPAGCGGPAGTAPTDPGTARPFAGVSLTLSCPDPAFAAAVTPLARAWAARTGAKVEVTSAPMVAGDSADAGVVSSAEVGAWAEKGEVAPVPPAVREPGHPYQWLSVLSDYRGPPYAGWGGQVFGLPLAGDGRVVVYRADRLGDEEARRQFMERLKHPLAAPATWEEYAEVAEFFTEADKKPALPPLPAGPAALADLFFRVAACYDRLALSESALGGKAARPELLAFQFELDKGRPRLGTDGFRKAAEWLHRLRPWRPAGEGDAAAELAAGRAVLAVLSLAELGRLRAEAAKPGGTPLTKFGIAPVPGSRQQREGNAVNYVPYFSGGRLGVVRKSCARPDAAFDLLADLGGPARSQELLGNPQLGVGPFRNGHLERERLLVWYEYGFDDARTKALQDALGQFVGKAVRNPVFGLRGPDAPALTAALGEELRRVAAREVKPEEAMKRATAAWEKLDANTPADKLRDQRRKAVGLSN